MSENTWSHQVARQVVRPLVGTPVTPNHITTLRLVTGVGAAAAFAIGSADAVIWAGVLFVVSTFLDRADGELARLAEQRSDWGDKYDVACDIAVHALLFVGIGIGLRHSLLGWWSVPMGLCAGAAVGAIYLAMIKIEDIQGAQEPVVPGAAGFDPDDPLYLVGPIAWFGLLLPFLVAAAIGAPAFAAWLFWRHRRLSRAPERHPPLPAGE